MKKLLLTFLLALPFLGRAQTQVSIDYHYESPQQSCTVPASYGFYIQASTLNYSVNDSADVYVDFGDGNDSTVRAGLYMSGPVGYVYLPNYVYHTYQAAGIFPVTYIVTMPDANADTVSTYVMVTATCGNVTGRLYVDANSNCTYDAGDSPIYGDYVDLDYNGVTVSSGYTDAQGMFVINAQPGYTYNMATSTTNGPAFILTCSTSQGMPVTPSPTAVQDLVVYDTTVVTITYANDSSFFSSGNCAPTSTNIYVQGTTMNYFSPNDTIDVYVNFGDGNDTIVRTPSYMNQTPIGNFYANLTHTYTAVGNYNLFYQATGFDGTNDTATRYNQVVVLDTCGNLEGTTYLDNNGNCIYDSGDSLLRWVPIELTNTSTGAAYWAYTDMNGHYSFSVLPGNYTVAISSWYISYTSITPTCPASGSSAVTVTASNTTTMDFGGTCSSTPDLGAWFGLYHGIFPTSYGYIYPWVDDHSCVNVAGSVQLILDPLVHFVGVCDTAFSPTVNGDTLTWTFATANNYYYWWYYWYSYQGCIQVIGDPSLQLGDSVCITMIVNPIAGDANPADNTVTHCYPALVSLDPNTKDVAPRGQGPLGYVGQNTRFNYTINFQNTGTTSAQNIFVLDTLDADLDPATLLVTGSSHAMEVTSLPGNVVRFNFPNIDLPDSTSDLAHSHGWVTYSISAKPNLADGTPIQNTAGIYFDFNAPVITNSTLNTIYDPASVHEIVEGNVTIYPNPASSTVEIMFANEMNATLQLTDLAGQEVMNSKVNGMKATIDVSTLPVGVYLLKVVSENGISVHKIIVQH